MKRRHLSTFLLTAALVLCLGVLPASAAGDGTALADLTWQADPDRTDTAVTLRTDPATGEAQLFLPAQADLSALTLTFGGGDITLSHGQETAVIQSGVPFDLTALFAGAERPAGGRWTVTLTRGAEKLSLAVMQSDGLPALFLTSADPARDRTWVEASKENKAEGRAVLLRPDGTPVYDGGLKQIKGRGNSTWEYPKKPYQIKLAEKTDLLGAGEAPEATWVLLANYCDETLLHNQVTYDLARDFALPYTPHCAPVDLYYDGEYRGSYLLSEKTEVGEGRVQVDDLEGDIEAADPAVEDLDDLPTATARNTSGNPFQYVTGLTVPQDYAGGYLLEMDFPQRAREEKSWFSTTAGKYLVVKSPEYMPQEAMTYLSDLWQAFEDAVYHGGTHPVTGQDYTDYVDLDSLARCYLLLELSQDEDAFQSSTFFYKPAGEEKFYAGPLWDFDSAYGSYESASYVDSFVAGRTAFGRELLEIPSFRAAVREAHRDLEPLVEQALETGILAHAAALSASQAMDHVLWPETTPGPYTDAIDGFRTHLQQRSQWLAGEVESWKEDTVIPPGFADVHPKAWYADPVSYVVAHGLMNGASEIHFEPDQTMTRAMVVTVLWRMAGSPDAGTDPVFSDVGAGSWYGKAVAWAAANGVVSGYPDGAFHPDWEVERQELVTIFYRFAETQGAEITAPPIPATYRDRNAVPSWAKSAFGWAIHAGIVTGTNHNTLEPQGLALRCEGAALFQRLHQNLELA